MQDSRLLIAGTISGLNNQLSGFSFASNNISTSAATLAPYSIDMQPQNLNGLTSNSGADWGEGTQLFLKYLLTTDQNGAAVNSGVTSLIINLLAATNAAMTSGVLTLASVTATVLTAGSYGYALIPPQIGSVGVEFLGASFQAGGAAATQGAIVCEITNVIDDPKKYFKSGFSVY